MRRLLLVAVLTAAAPPAPAETVNCTNITALPATITAPGVYCLKQDLATSMTSGNAITVAANSVTIDFNGYRLGGLGAGPNTQAFGVFAQDRKNITLRNGNIRGFVVGIRLEETASSNLSSGHVIEDNLLEGNTAVGVRALGSGIVIRRNRIINTDSTPPPGPSMQFSSALVAPADAGADSVGKASGASAKQPAPQAGTGAVMNGIAVRARNSQIVDNFIATSISSGSEAHAIFVSTTSANVEVSRNAILETNGAGTTTGIAINSPGLPAHTVSDNVIIGVSPTVGTANGIYVYAGSAICRDNTVENVTNNAVGCTAESGTFPPVAP